MFILLLITTYLSPAYGQVYIFEKIDDHEGRLTTIESMMTNVTSCCSDLRQQNALLQSQNQKLEQMVNNLTQEFMSLKQAMATASQITSVFTSPTTATKAYPEDCTDAANSGMTKSGIYRIQPQNSNDAVSVFCDMENDGGKWTVIQRRVDGSADFNQNWDAYKFGFGFFNGEFWIGNELLHKLTAGGNNLLHIKLQDWNGMMVYAEYQNFNVDTELSGYTMSVGKYSGTAGDSLNYPQSPLLKHNGMRFSTPDRDQDRSSQNCAAVLQSGWWFSDCYSSNLNGVYNTQGPNGQLSQGQISGIPSLSGSGVEWYPWKHTQYSLKMVEMKIRHV